MRHARHPAYFVLITAVTLLAACSATPSAQKAQSPSAPTSPSRAPATTLPADDAVDASATSRSIAANLGDPARFRAIFANLKQAVAKHDPAAVANLVSYPITVNPHTKLAMRIPTPTAFVAAYDRIITPHIADVIEKQNYDDLFVNYQGAMFGSGEVWIAGICKDNACKQVDVKVRTIQNTGMKSP